MSKVEGCRGCKQQPLIFDCGDYESRTYFGCPYSEKYISEMGAYGYKKPKEATAGCRLNYISVADFDGELTALIEGWNDKQTKASQLEDEKRDAQYQNLLTTITAKTLGLPLAPLADAMELSYRTSPKRVVFDNVERWWKLSADGDE